MKSVVNLFVLLLICLGMAACSSPGVKNLGDGSGNPEDLVVTENIGPNDLTQVAQKIADDMKNSPAIKASPDKPAVVRVRPFINETDDVNFPMAELVDTVINELTRTGRLEAITSDAAANEAFILKQKLNRRSGVHLEDYTLTGRVTRLVESAGNKRQYTYYFNFVVNNTDTGTKALTSQTRIIKLKRK